MTETTRPPLGDIPDRRTAVATALRRIAPRLPDFEAGVVLDRALASPALRRAAPETAARLCLIAYARHAFTDYDDLLADGYDRDSARHFVLDDMNEALTAWGARPVPEEAEDAEEAEDGGDEPGRHPPHDALGARVAPPGASSGECDLMKISARNVLKGTVVSIDKGATTAHVKIEISPGQVVTASITNESVESLKLVAGGPAYAVIKASDVMVAVD